MRLDVHLDVTALRVRSPKNVYALATTHIAHFIVEALKMKMNTDGVSERERESERVSLWKKSHLLFI